MRSPPPSQEANAAASEGHRPRSRFDRAREAWIGAPTGSIDSWTGERKTEDFWGVVWSSRRRVNRIAYTTGRIFAAGEWFTSLRPQIRSGGEWKDIAGAAVTPAYPASREAGEHRTYVFAFDAREADGVRVVGAPGGDATFTSASEISGYLE